ncbi:hydroxymethylbilane synthase [Leptospira noumeaensis]|uniref:Hydroxymethylbilane synthase n=1 Tax=Leptospira noumeaensis TaxID=2484964 RepID=A0A4V3JKF6_9LEPT|nr:hydroxymethylbilane synthase [Leptospira noumeaensis]TGK84578.1 hydroxymethylbilane synthase [Leptospira noumeaensis]
MSDTIKIGGRSSLLSRIQILSVITALQQKNKTKTFQTVFRESAGDKDLKTPLWQFPGQGIFTKDLQEDLLNYKIDIAIHSWKDMDLRERKETILVPILPREDVRDVLLFKRNKWISAPTDITILTSSPRREHHIKDFVKSYFPTPINSFQVNIESVRGNIQTRLRKYLDHENGGIIVAKAALDRILNFEDLENQIPELNEVKQLIRDTISLSLFMVMPSSIFPSAPAQGALCAEIRKGDKHLESLLREISNADAETTANEERKILSQYGGGCHQKIGVSVLIRDYGKITFISGETEDGKKLFSKELSESPDLIFNKTEVWPPNAKMAARQRERLTYNIPKDVDVFVSRGYAFPLDLSVNPTNQILWSAGLSTWKDLALRGFWVNGTCDGLGESEPPLIDLLLGRTPNFVKLTHVDSDKHNSIYPVIPTYFVSAPEIPVPFDITNIKAAYWRSGSEFDIVTKRFPELLDVIHFVGPGSTFKKIKQTIGEEASKERVFVSLSFDSWVEKYIKP